MQLRNGTQQILCSVASILLILLTLLNATSVSAQPLAFAAVMQESVTICSIDNARWQAADSGYTLNGSWMNTSTRPKLLNATNFGASGTISITITIVDKFAVVGSLNASSLTECNIVFHGWANENPLTDAELDALYTWSTQDKGMVIIAEHPESAPYPKPQVTERWGYNSASPTVNPTIPTTTNSNHALFAGPFGTVTKLEQAGTLRGYITVPICQGATTLANDTNGNGRPTVVYDGSTGDIILPDVDMLTGLNPAISVMVVLIQTKNASWLISSPLLSNRYRIHLNRMNSTVPI